MAGCVIRIHRSRFGAAFLSALFLALVAAVLIAPIAGFVVAGAGFQIPFPRIFDRVIMVAAAVALLLFASQLQLSELLREGLRYTRSSLPQIAYGLGLGLMGIAVLFGVASVTLHRPLPIVSIMVRAARFLGAALVIGLIEETFFRAILLGGLSRDFGSRPALFISAAVYSITHLIRSPKHYFLTGFHPAAGLYNLGASVERIAHPGNLLAMALGLFLLGLVLGEAFIRTRRVYLAIGIHAGVVIGAKCWSVVAAGASLSVPRWLAGPGPVPLIAAPGAWIICLILVGLISQVSWVQES
jgi:membrane protease YdiL (CAAX protease family)